MLLNKIINCCWIISCTSQYQITVKYKPDIAGGGLLKESLVLYNQELNMQNQFGNQDLVLQNDRIDCFKRLTVLKENIIPHPYFYITVHYLKNLLYQFFKDLRAYLFYLLAEVIFLQSTNYTAFNTLRKHCRANKEQTITTFSSSESVVRKLTTKKLDK